MFFSALKCCRFALFTQKKDSLSLSSFSVRVGEGGGGVLILCCFSAMQGGDCQCGVNRRLRCHRTSSCVLTAASKVAKVTAAFDSFPLYFFNRFFKEIIFFFFFRQGCKYCKTGLVHSNFTALSYLVWCQTITS